MPSGSLIESVVYCLPCMRSTAAVITRPSPPEMAITARMRPPSAYTSGINSALATLPVIVAFCRTVGILSSPSRRASTAAVQPVRSAACPPRTTRTSQRCAALSPAASG